MKNVLVDMHRLREHPFNGLYTFSFNLGKSLAATQHAGVNLHYYLPPQQFGLFGSDVHYVAHRSIDKFYKPGTSRFDVWHATTTISWYRPFNRRTKFIFTIHDLNFLLEEPENTARNKRMLQRIQARVDRADHLTAISQFALDMAAQYLDIRGKPATVVYNGCNVNDFPGFDAPRYRPARPFLFTIGLVQPRKNFHLLPALLEGNDYELVIAGLDHFEYRKVVEDAVQQHGVRGRVRLLGAVSEEEKYWYYKNCSAFLFPSYAEGFGLPAIEAMHFGKPVFLSNRTCLPEIGGDAAYYFTSFDEGHMRQVFNEGMADYWATNPAEKIRRRSAEFSWTGAASQYLEIYRSV